MAKIPKILTCPCCHNLIIDWANLPSPEGEFSLSYFQTLLERHRSQNHQCNLIVEDQVEHIGSTITIRRNDMMRWSDDNKPVELSFTVDAPRSPVPGLCYLYSLMIVISALYMLRVIGAAVLFYQGNPLPLYAVDWLGAAMEYPTLDIGLLLGLNVAIIVTANHYYRKLWKNR